MLKNYTPYRTAFRLTHNGQSYESQDTANAGTVAVTGSANGELVDKTAAIKSAMNWVKLHPTNISQKVQIIVEHFRTNVGPRLDGKAKAMVVTSSRKAAVRYKLAFDKYIAEKGYDDIAALVAFSGEVTDLDSAVEKVSETSTLINPGYAAGTSGTRSPPTSTRSSSWPTSFRPGLTSRCWWRCTWTRDSPASLRCRHFRG